jgi:peptidoglycan/LPS O-acetylase OafA/YrhL
MNSSVKAQSNLRIPELDGIRGLAIALVVFQHYVQASIVPGTSRFGDFIKGNFTLGATGVNLFFVLSGFLIGGILMDHRSSENYFKSFYIRRACRILPLYYGLLIAFVFTSWLLSSHAAETWFKWAFDCGISLWAYVPFTQVIFHTALYSTGQIVPDWLSPTWTLAVEEQFYLMLPLVVWLVRPAWVWRLCLAFVCVRPVLFFFLWLYHPVLFINAILILPIQADALPVGVICAYLVRQEKFREWLKESRCAVYTIFCLLLCGAGYFATKYALGNYEVGRDLLFFPWMALLYGLLVVLAVTHQAGIPAGLLRWAPLRGLGIISYGVYLIHQPVSDSLHGLLLGKKPSLENFLDNLMTLAALFLTLILAGVSWRFFEKPIVTWGHSFLYGNRKAMCAGEVQESTKTIIAT